MLTTVTFLIGIACVAVSARTRLYASFKSDPLSDVSELSPLLILGFLLESAVLASSAGAVVWIFVPNSETWALLPLAFMLILMIATFLGGKADKKKFAGIPVSTANVGFIALIIQSLMLDMTWHSTFSSFAGTLALSVGGVAIYALWKTFDKEYSVPLIAGSYLLMVMGAGVGAWVWVELGEYFGISMIEPLDAYTFTGVLAFSTVLILVQRVLMFCVSRGEREIKGGLDMISMPLKAFTFAGVIYVWVVFYRGVVALGLPVAG